MSVNWHYFKVIQKKGQQTATAAAAEVSKKVVPGTSKDLKAFTDYTVDQREVEKNGRAWRAEELRLKSHDDLHKLWYVLLKEKNKLKSDFLMSKQLQQYFFGFDNMMKVNLSMSRLLTVVNERKKLRNEYRAYLEDKYIAEQKAKELERIKTERSAHNSEVREKGKTPKPNEYEINVKRNKELAHALKELQKTERQLFKRFKESGNYTSTEPSERAASVNMAPTLNNDDIKFIATAQAKLPQREIMKMYVGNYSALTLKQRRQVTSFIQA